MKIKLLSDLHCEGHKFDYEYSGEDVLVLAGDIHTRNRHHELLDKVPNTVTVLLVAGNHEYYHGEFHTVNKYLKSLESKFCNTHFLNNDSVKINGVNFFGGTMYTDFTLYGIYEQWFAIQAARTGINDFRLIKVYDIDHEPDNRRWDTTDHQEEHRKFCEELNLWLKMTEGQKRVVISHFAPHPQTCDPKYGKSPLNAYFTEDMSAYMGWEGLWLFGHTHSSYDGMIGDTRVIANPKGYGNENHSNFNSNLLIEV